MYLSKLTKTEKLKFMDLAYIIVNSDGKFTAEEKKMIKQYIKEMEIEKFKKSDNDIDDIIKFFVTKKPLVKKIIFLESLVLAMSDNKYAPAEKIIVEKMASSFKFSTDTKKEFFKAAKDIIKLYSGIFNLIGIRP